MFISSTFVIVDEIPENGHRQRSKSVLLLSKVALQFHDQIDVIAEERLYEAVVHAALTYVTDSKGLLQQI